MKSNRNYSVKDINGNVVKLFKTFEAASNYVVHMGASFTVNIQ